MTVAINDNGTALFEEVPGTDEKKLKQGAALLFKDTEVTINVHQNGLERARKFAGSSRIYVEIMVSSTGTIGWVLDSRLNRNFVLEEPPAVSLDKQLFASICLSAARLIGVNLHYLLALAQLKSGLTDFRPGASGVAGGEKRTGPYAVSLAEWNEHKTAPAEGINFIERDRFDPYNQPYVAALRARARIEKLQRLGLAPTLKEVYFWELLPEALLEPLLKFDAQRFLADAVLDILKADEHVGGEEAALAQLVASDRDLFFSGDTKRTIEGAKAAASERLQKALNDTATLISQIPLDELAGDTPRAQPSDKASDASGYDVLLKWTEGQHVNVYGHLVLRLQQGLNRTIPAGVSPIDEDLEFGKGTGAALNRWLKGRGRPESGTLSYRDWQELSGEPPPTIFDLCAQVTAAFEGHGFEKLVSNVGTSDPAVLTWGYNGFTFKFGKIQQVLKTIDTADPNVITTIFGAKAGPLRQMLSMPSIDQQIDWVTTHMLVGNSLKDDWRDSFAQLGKNRLVQDVQLAQVKSEYWENIAVKQMAFLGLSNPLSQALLYDIAIQNGGFSDRELKDVKIEFDKLGPPSVGEARHREVMVKALLNREGINETAVIGRKTILRTGFAKKSSSEGKAFHLGYWGLEPRLAPLEARDGAAKLSDIASFPDFEAFFNNEIGENDFVKAKHFLYKGSNQAKSGGLNSDPPKELWKNISQVAQLLKALSEELKTAIQFNSVYRNRAYNKFVDGEPESRHIYFDAVDFKPLDVPLRDAHELLHSWRSGPSPLYQGGLHRYDTFIHVDTRGRNANW